MVSTKIQCQFKKGRQCEAVLLLLKRLCLQQEEQNITRISEKLKEILCLISLSGKVGITIFSLTLKIDANENATPLEVELGQKGQKGVAPGCWGRDQKHQEGVWWCQDSCACSQLSLQRILLLPLLTFPSVPAVPATAEKIALPLSP